MAYKFYDSELIDIVEITPHIKRFFFRIPEEEVFPFNPGQFVMLDLPISSKITTRSYSIASAPVGNNVIELLISINHHGLGTPYLFNEVKVGSHLPLSQAAGKFMQPPATTIETDVCLICTGTGIAPFRSWLFDLAKRKVQHKNIDLIFGCRFEPDILYKDEMMLLVKEVGGFQHIPVLSRENSPAYTGEKGYVHPIYQKLYADKRPAMFYICGWKAMIKEARENLAAMGYDKKQIKFELYD